RTTSTTRPTPTASSSSTPCACGSAPSSSRPGPWEPPLPTSTTPRPYRGSAEVGAALWPAGTDPARPTVRLRDATLADAERLADLFAAAGRPDRDAAAMRAWLTKGGALLVEREGGPVLAAVRWLPSDPGWRVERVTTRPDERGNGYGRWLMTKLEALAIKGNVPLLDLEVEEDDEGPRHQRGARDRGRAHEAAVLRPQQRHAGLAARPPLERGCPRDPAARHGAGPLAVEERAHQHAQLGQAAAAVAAQVEDERARAPRQEVGEQLVRPRAGAGERERGHVEVADGAVEQLGRRCPLQLRVRHEARAEAHGEGLPRGAPERELDALPAHAGAEDEAHAGGAQALERRVPHRDDHVAAPHAGLVRRRGGQDALHDDA